MKKKIKDLNPGEYFVNEWGFKYIAAYKDFAYYVQKIVLVEGDVLHLRRIDGADGTDEHRKYEKYTERETCMYAFSLEKNIIVAYAVNEELDHEVEVLAQ
jgi:phage FluMu gp28-like protein